MLTTVAEPVSGHQPYLLQVLCCHLFDECIREDVPIITTRLVAKMSGAECFESSVITSPVNGRRYRPNMATQ